MPAEDFGRVADIYDATRSLPEGEMARLLDAFAARVRRPGPVVDVGVGTGRFAGPLQRRGYEVVGLDISRAMMAKAREKRVADLFFADVRKMPFRDRVFECALLVHVLHLVPEWAAVVKEAARVTSGKLISVVEEGDGINLGREYRAKRTAMGYPLNRFEGGERGLAEIVAPDELVEVVDTTRVSQADDEILQLQRREQSLTFDMPEEPHQEVIRTLKERHGGRTIKRQSRIKLAVWSAAKVRAESI